MVTVHLLCVRHCGSASAYNSDHGIIFCLEDNSNKSVIQVMLGEGTQGEESSSPAEGSKFLLGDRNSSKYKDEAGGCTRPGGAVKEEEHSRERQQLLPVFLSVKRGS